MKLALVAHDAKKDTLVGWAQLHERMLQPHMIFATGTTGGRIVDALPSLDVTPLKSGPLGGDQQLGAMICEGKLDALFFFVDPLSPMPHDVDVKALSRLAIVYDLPLAQSPSTAGFVLDGLLKRDSNKAETLLGKK
ncbi:MAG: methylglyoxal synthase [Pseudomonadota bacterium]